MVQQNYVAYVEMEHVVLGNDALFKCKIPSYVADLASVAGWVDSQGNDFATAGQGNSRLVSSSGLLDLGILRL